MIRKVILPLLVVAVSVGAAMTLMATSPTLEPNTPVPIPTSVRVMDVVPHSVTMSVLRSGTQSRNCCAQISRLIHCHKKNELSPFPWKNCSIAVSARWRSTHPLAQNDGVST